MRISKGEERAQLQNKNVRRGSTHIIPDSMQHGYDIILFWWKKG